MLVYLYICLYLNSNIHGQPLATENNRQGTCHDKHQATPLWPHDFTHAFQRSQAWVLSIVAGETYEKVKQDQSSKLSFKPKSEGSGVIWGPNKLIITNAHVVKGHNIIRARTYQRQVLKLELVGMYEGLDLAVLKTSTAHALNKLPNACYTKELPPIGS
jgi:S1-C subfamily serine protease